MSDRAGLEMLFARHGYADFKWIEPAQIVVSQWVRMKCMFGCPDYGRNASCPPNVPSVTECRAFFDEYHTAAVFHFAKSVDKPEQRGAWSRKVNQSLLKLERMKGRQGWGPHGPEMLPCCQLKEQMCYEDRRRNAP
jgi:predicted metal-binding protein